MSTTFDQAIKNTNTLLDNFNSYKNTLLKGLDDNIKFENFSKSLDLINDTYISLTSVLISFLHEINSKYHSYLYLA